MTEAAATGFRFAYSDGTAEDQLADAAPEVRARVEGLQQESREARAMQQIVRADAERLEESIRNRALQIHQAEMEESRSGQNYHTERRERDTKDGGEVITRVETGYVAKLKRAQEEDNAQLAALRAKKSRPDPLVQVVEDLSVPRALDVDDPVTWTPNEGETISDGYTREWGELVKLVRAEESTWNAGRSVDEMIATSHAEIDRLAASGAPKLGGHRRGHTITHRGKQVATTPEIEWPSTLIVPFEPQAIDGARLVAWLFPKELKAAIAAQIRKTYGDEDTITAAAKPALIADLQKRIWNQRKVLEAAYLFARAAGIKNLNRPKRTPSEVLIGVRKWSGVKQARVMAAPLAVVDNDADETGDE